MIQNRSHLLLLRATFLPMIFMAVLGAVEVSHAGGTGLLPECLPAATINDLLKQTKVLITKRPDKSLWENPTNYCDKGMISTKVLRALAVLDKVGTLPSAKDALDQGILGESAKKYFQGLITTIVIGPHDGDDRTCAEHWAYTSKSHPKTLFACPHLVDLGDATAAGILIHEATHAGTNRLQHGRCGDNILASQASDGCDRSLQAKGTYAAEVEFLVKLSRMPGISKQLEYELRKAIMTRLAQNFSELPVGISAGALLQRADGQLSFFDSKVISPSFQPRSPKEIAWSRFGLPFSIDPEMKPTSPSNSKPAYQSNLFISPSRYEFGGLPSDLSNLPIQELIAEGIIDIQEIPETRPGKEPDSALCVLTQQSLTCARSYVKGNESSQPKREYFKVPHSTFKLKPIGLGTIGVDFIVMHEAGNYSVLNPDFIEAKTLSNFVSQGQMPFAQNWRSVVSLDRTQSTLVFIDINGVVGSYMPGQGKPAYDQRLTGQKFLRISGPMMWSKQLSSF